MDRHGILPFERFYEEPHEDGKPRCAASRALAQRCPPGTAANVFTAAPGDAKLRRAASRASAQHRRPGTTNVFAGTPGVFPRLRRAVGAHSPYGPLLAFLPQ